jgi:DNA-binding Xre family transcriptional regulator
MTDTPTTYVITGFHAQLLLNDVQSKEIARYLRVQKSHVSEWKNGTRPIPRHYLLPLCRLWKCRPSDLTGMVELTL